MTAVANPATVGECLRAGAGFSQGDLNWIAEQFATLDGRLASFYADTTELEVSVKDRAAKGQKVTLECWIAGRQKIVTTSSEGDLHDALSNGQREHDLELGKELVTDRVGDLCATGQRVVVFSAPQDPDTVRAVLEAGASAVMSKELGTEDHCVRTILDAAADLLAGPDAAARTALIEEPCRSERSPAGTTMVLPSSTAGASWA